MPGLVPGIHVLLSTNKKVDADGRDKPGHDANDKSWRRTLGPARREC
jgi:hypothetical protein